MSDETNEITRCVGTSLPLGPIPHGGQVHLQLLIEQFGHSTEHHSYVLAIRPNEGDPHAPFRLTVKPYIHHNPPPPPPETDQQRRHRLVLEAIRAASKRSASRNGVPPFEMDATQAILEALDGEFEQDVD